MRNSLSSFKIEVEAESCLFMISDPMLRDMAYQYYLKMTKHF